MIDPVWLNLALTPPRAFGGPVGRGRLRSEPEDFVVEEQLGFEPSGAGQHALLRIRKRNANTEWVARALARVAGCRPHDVGYAGLKDRRAVSTQWFTVPQSIKAPIAWQDVSIEGCEVLEAHAHLRKLPRGALSGNRFVIRIRDLKGDGDALRTRVAAIAQRGVPNYFGPQRFGRDANNLARIAGGIAHLHPNERGFVLSAARSVVFNAVLSERVRDGSWEKLEAGDVANLDGSGSIFPVDELTPDLQERGRTLDIHPSGPMWGAGDLLTQGRVLDLETRVGTEFALASAMATEAGMRQERRGLRMPVRELTAEFAEGEVTLRFELGKGSFATTVLSELVDFASEEGDS